jgi:hypothetical protein
VKTIYIDLDDCLIHSVFGVRNTKRRTVMHLDEEKYSVLERPLAKKMLTDLRELGHLRMLTTATPDYAQEVNRIFGFDFAQNDVISLVPLLVTVQLAYGSDTLLTKTHTDPHSILIDHQSPQDKWLRTKMLYLGVKENSYIQIREFAGIDPFQFPKEWESKYMPRINQMATQSPDI